MRAAAAVALAVLALAAAPARGAVSDLVRFWGAALWGTGGQPPAALVRTCGGAHRSPQSHLLLQGPRLTAKLLNASAAVAAKPKVNATVTALSDTAEAESAVDQKLGLAVAKGVITPTATSAALPLATLYGKCGAGVAKCMHGCCSSTGQCMLSPDACGPLCQASYSAIMAPCASNPVPAPPSPSTLPIVGLGAPCGSYVGICSEGCCNQLNYCVAEGEGGGGG